MSIIIPGLLDRIRRHGPGNGLAIGLGVDARKRTCARFSSFLPSQTRTSYFTQYLRKHILIGIYIKKEKNYYRGYWRVSSAPAAGPASSSTTTSISASFSPSTSCSFSPPASSVFTHPASSPSADSSSTSITSSSTARRPPFSSFDIKWSVMLCVSSTIPLRSLPIWKRALRIWATSTSRRWLWSHCSSSKSVRSLSLTDGPATSSSEPGSVSRAFPFPFPIFIFLDRPASALIRSTAHEILPRWQKQQVRTFLLSCLQIQDLLSRWHGLQIRPFSALHEPPSAVVRVPSIVNPDPACFRFFISMCGPVPGSAVFSISSTSMAFALSSVALVLSSNLLLCSSAKCWSLANVIATSLLLRSSSRWAVSSRHRLSCSASTRASSSNLRSSSCRFLSSS